MKLAIASNMLNEADADLAGWVENMNQIGCGIVVVDGKSTDGTQDILRDLGCVVVEDPIIQTEGYGPARNQLRELSRKHFPNANWIGHFDADERISPEDFHTMMYLMHYLREDLIDVIALPRNDWHDYEMKKLHVSLHIRPDYQARITRANSGVKYVRKCHEQIIGWKGVYQKLTNPKIQHFHRCAGQDKRDFVGKVCADLHMRDDEYGHTYPQHKKEQFYRDKLAKEGLGI